MKKAFILVLAMVLLVTLLPVISSANGVPSDAQYYKLIAAQDTLVGNVAVWYDGTSIHVKYQAQTIYCLNEIHTDVAASLADIPQNKGGPIPGQFFWKEDDLGCARTAEAIIPFSWDGEGDLFIVAHAVVGKVDDPCWDPCSEEECWQETAWGLICGHFELYGFPGRNWAAYILFPQPD
jgi:hypothetical protein